MQGPTYHATMPSSDTAVYKFNFLYNSEGDICSSNCYYVGMIKYKIKHKIGNWENTESVTSYIYGYLQPLTYSTTSKYYFLIYSRQIPTENPAPKDILLSSTTLRAVQLSRSSSIYFQHSINNQFEQK